MGLIHHVGIVHAHSIRGMRSRVYHQIFWDQEGTDLKGGGSIGGGSVAEEAKSETEDRVVGGGDIYTGETSRT